MILPPWLWRLVHSRKLWILSISLPVLGLVLFYTIANLWGARKLDQARKELSAKGYALTWAEVIQSGVAPEEDLLRHEVMVQNPHDVEADLLAKGYDQSRLNDWIPQYDEISTFSAAKVCGRPEAEEGASIKQLTTDLASMEPTASEIKEAVRSSKGIGWKIPGTSSTQAEPLPKTVLWMNKWILRRAVLRAAAGDGVGAIDDLRVVHEYLDLLHKEPRTLRSTWLGVSATAIFSDSAWQIAQMPAVGSEELREMSRWLDSLDIGTTTVDCYQREMVSMNDELDSSFGSITTLPPNRMSLHFSWMDARKWWEEGKNQWWQVLPAGLCRAKLAETLVRIDREILQLPDGKKRKGWTERDADRFESYQGSQLGGWTNALDFPIIFFNAYVHSLPSIIREGLEVQTTIRFCRSGIAAELFRRDHGQLPSAMDDLVPTYLPEVPVDAISEGRIWMETVFDDEISFIANEQGHWLRIPARQTPK